jgi:hypothetical protein
MPAHRRGIALAYLRRSSSSLDFDARRQLVPIVTETARQGLVLDAKIDDLDHMEKAGLKHLRGIVLEAGPSAE